MYKRQAEDFVSNVGGDVLDAPQNIELLPYGEIADKYINQLNEAKKGVRYGKH